MAITPEPTDQSPVGVASDSRMECKGNTTKEMECKGNKQDICPSMVRGIEYQASSNVYWHSNSVCCASLARNYVPQTYSSRFNRNHLAEMPRRLPPAGLHLRLTI